MFYIAADDILRDKHVYVTRFPIANFQNIYPSKIKILSTAKTHEVWLSFSTYEDIKGISDKDIEEIHEAMHFKEYPLIPCKAVPYSKNDTAFYDVMLCGNAYLDSLRRRL